MDTNLDNQFPRTRDIIQKGIDQKLHLGMQVYVSRNNEILADFAIGENRVNFPLTTQTLCLWLSSGKPLTATAVFQFLEAGQLSLSDRVALHVPEFAANGKEDLTIANLLTHTGGLRPVASGWPSKSWGEIIQRISKERLRRNWEPDEMGAYDPALSWFMLGEVLQRIDGRTIDQIVRQDILEPIGMVDSWMAIPKHLHRAYDERIGVMHSVIDHDFRPTRGHEQLICESPSPGGSMRGPISQLGKFYEMLLRGGTSADGKQILSPESVQLMTQRQRVGLNDFTFQHQVDFGYGVIVNSNRYGKETVPYGFGRYASEESFGHGGAQSSIGFADPKHQLVVAAVANGCPGEELHNKRFRELNSAIYQDLGLANDETVEA